MVLLVEYNIFVLFPPLNMTYSVCLLQASYDLVLRTFSIDCKKMSVEIFEQTMPSAKHWRINQKNGTDAMNENL